MSMVLLISVNCFITTENLKDRQSHRGITHWFFANSRFPYLEVWAVLGVEYDWNLSTAVDKPTTVG